LFGTANSVPFEFSYEHGTYRFKLEASSTKSCELEAKFKAALKGDPLFDDSPFTRSNATFTILPWRPVSPISASPADSSCSGARGRILLLLLLPLRDGMSKLPEARGTRAGSANIATAVIAATLRVPFRSGCRNE